MSGILAARSESTAPPAQVKEVARQVETLAAVEPPALSADTLAELSKALTPTFPDEARNWAISAWRTSTRIKDELTRNLVEVRVIGKSTDVDGELALQFARQLPFRAQRSMRESAFDAILTNYAAATPGRLSAIAKEAISSGAVCLRSLRRILAELRQNDPRDAQRLLATFIDHFPVDGAGSRDVFLLLDLTRELQDTAPGIGKRAVEAAVTALCNSRFQNDWPERITAHFEIGDAALELSTGRSAAALEVLGYAKSNYPHIYQSARNRVLALINQPVPLDQLTAANAIPRRVSHRLIPTPNAETLHRDSRESGKRGGLLRATVMAAAPRAAVAAIRSAGDPETGIPLLLELVRRQDISRRDGAAALEEVLREVGMLPATETQLASIQQAMKAAYERGEIDLLSQATRVFSASARTFCKCTGATCNAPDGRYGCLDIYLSVAGFLHSTGLDPGRLAGIDNSLSARMKVFALSDSLQGAQ